MVHALPRRWQSLLRRNYGITQLWLEVVPWSVEQLGAITPRRALIHRGSRFAMAPYLPTSAAQHPPSRPVGQADDSLMNQTIALLDRVLRQQLGPFELEVMAGVHRFAGQFAG